MPNEQLLGHCDVSAVAVGVRFHHWGLGFRQCSFRLITRVLRDGTVSAFRWLPLLWRALFPSSFCLQVNQMTQKLPSEFLLTASGIQCRVPRRTALTHPVLQPTDSPAHEGSPVAIRASYVDRVRGLDVPHLFPSPGSAGRRFASLPRVLRGEFPCFNGTTRALRLPAAHPAALRCLRLAVPPRSLVLFAPRQTSALPGPGVGHPVAPAGMLAEETTGAPKFLGHPDCPFALFTRRRQDCGHQTSTVPQRGPWYV
jgi:hypothetical protein